MKRIHVMVLGALPGQCQILRQKLKGTCLEIEAGMSPRRGYAVYVYWARFMPHSAQEQAKRAGGRLILHHGGLSGMVAVLRGLL